MSEPLDDFFDPVDDAEWRPAREIFARLGYVPLPPGEVDDFQLRGRLWEFIHALAGRRFFLHHTNHLSDRELYTWLHDRWFPEETADCPPEAETNCHIDLTEALADDGETFLRYYASEADRLVWADADPAQPLPPHEDPPFDRDRFLPDPWRPSETGTPATEALEEDEEERAEDPLGLAAVDAALAEAERERQAERDAAEAKTMGEVAGTGKKPWRQKGTGRARAGSFASPLWRGGGVVHGPKPRDFSKKVNKKVARLALRKALSERLKAGDVIVVDDFKLAAPKTKEFVSVLKGLEIEGNTLLLVVGSADETLVRAARNVPGVELATGSDVNTYELLRSDKLLFTKEAFAQVEARLAE